MIMKWPSRLPGVHGEAWPARGRQPGRRTNLGDRKTLLLLIPLAAAGVAASQWQDITATQDQADVPGKRPPGNVPTGGSQAYPKP
jgi:hypothetical protein